MFLSQSALSKSSVTSPWGINMSQRHALRRARLIIATPRETVGLLASITIALCSVTAVVGIVAINLSGPIGYTAFLPLMAWIGYLTSRPHRRKQMRERQRQLFVTPEDYSYRVLFQVLPFPANDNDLRALQPLRSVIDGYFRSTAGDDEAIQQGDTSRMLDINKKARAIRSKCAAITDYSHSVQTVQHPSVLQYQPAR